MKKVYKVNYGFTAYFIGENTEDVLKQMAKGLDIVCKKSEDFDVTECHIEEDMSGIVYENETEH